MTTSGKARVVGRAVLKVGYTVLVVALMLVVLELTARFLGVGDPILYYNDAWGGVRPLPAQRVSRLHGATVTIDANGYRSARAVEPGALRILYLGDSVTWGGTSLDDTAIFAEIAADVVRAQGRPVYAMNAGVNGTALVNHAEIFLRHADSVDVVVWLFPWGDVVRNYATVGPLMPARFKPRFALVEALDHVIFRYWIVAFRERQPPNRAFWLPDLPTGREALYARVLAERKAKNLEAARGVVAEAQRRGLPLVLGVTPYCCSGDRLEPLPDEAVAFLEDMERLGARRFDVTAALERSPDPVPALFVDVVHFSAAGHRAVGDALGRMLAAVPAVLGGADQE